MLGRVTQSVARLTQEPEVPGSIRSPATYFVPSSADSRRTGESMCTKYWLTYNITYPLFHSGQCDIRGYNILYIYKTGLSLLKKSVVRLTDCLDMTLAVYRGRKTTKNNKNNNSHWKVKHPGRHPTLIQYCALAGQ